MSWGNFAKNFLRQGAHAVIDKALGSEGGDTYTIKSGDTLTTIASAHGTTVKDLLAANPSIEDPDMILAGASLNIPGGGMGADKSADELTEDDLPEGLKDLVAASGGLDAFKQKINTMCSVHCCHCGDTLNGAADALGADPSLVAQLNPVVPDPAAALPEGTELLVPSAQALQSGMGCAGGDEGMDGDDGMGGFFGDIAKQLAGHAIDQLGI